MNLTLYVAICVNGNFDHYLDIAYTNREHQRYLVNQMDELSARQLAEKEKAMREHEADLAKEAAYQQRIKDALKFY